MKKTFFFLLTILLFNNVIAQTVVSASNADNVITGISNYCEAVNCDMVTCPDDISNHLRVIAWDDTQPYFQVWDNMGNSTSITSIPNGYGPDVVIGCYDVAGVINYEVCVVYTTNNLSGNEVYLNRYTVTGVGTPSLAISTPTVTLISTLGNSAWLLSAHIDMFADNSQSLGVLGLPSLHEYAITWVENVSGSGLTTFLHTGDLTSATSNSTSIGAGQLQDVACITDISNGDRIALIINSSSGWSTAATDLVEYNLNSGNISTTNFINSSTIYNPRIEAMNLYDPTSGDAKFVASMIGGSIPNNMYVYTDIPSLPTSLQCYTYNRYSLQSAVAAGVGSSIGLGSNIGNTQYTVAWDIVRVSTTPGEVHSRGVDLTTGGFTSSLVYQMNNTVFSTYSSGIDYPVAICNSSNSGDDMLAAWYNGADIVYKLTGNSMAFKSANVVSDIDFSSTLSLYPNPSKDVITVGIKNGNYNITDITGHILINGELNGKEINVSSLSSGIYFMNVELNGVILNTRFLKE